ncbi:hypothetical protein ES705_24749 [subsurface metagenome]
MKQIKLMVTGLLLFTIIFFGMAVAVQAQTNELFTVHGQVFDTDGTTTPLDDVEVIVTNQDTEDSLSSVTSMGGWYSVNLANMVNNTNAVHIIEVSATFGGKTDSESFARGPVRDSPKRVDLTLEVEPTPTPTPEVTPTPTPTPAPPARRGGGAPREPEMNVPVDPETGAVLETTMLTVDGATLTFPKGTVVKDAGGNPLATSIFMLYAPTIAESVGAIEVYDFGPAGLTFVPAIDLVIPYDPADIPAGFAESDLVVRMWDGTAWIDFDTTVDTETHVATAKVSHFTIFGLFAAAPVAAPPTPTPVVTPSPTPEVTPTPTPSPIPRIRMAIVIVVVVAIVAVAIIVAVAFVPRMRRRKKS